jgi:hypothetical protein
MVYQGKVKPNKVVVTAAGTIKLNWSPGRNQKGGQYEAVVYSPEGQLICTLPRYLRASDALADAKHILAKEAAKKD